MLNEFPLERKLHSLHCPLLSSLSLSLSAWQCFRWIMMLLKCNLFFFFVCFFFFENTRKHAAQLLYPIRFGSLWLALILTAYCATQRQFVMNFILFYYFSQNCIFRQQQQQQSILLPPIESYVRCWSLISVLSFLLLPLQEQPNYRAANKAIINYRTCEPWQSNWLNCRGRGREGEGDSQTGWSDECFGKSELCTSAYWYVHYWEYLKRFLRLSAPKLHIGKPTLCNQIAQTTLSLSLLLLQNSSCAYLSKHFRWENWKSCTWKAKEKCLKKCFAFCQANAFAPDEAQRMCKVFRTEQQRRKSRTVDRAKYGTRKTATAEQQRGIFIVCGWKIDVRVVLRCTVLCRAVIDASHKQHGVCVM